MEEECNIIRFDKPIIEGRESSPQMWPKDPTAKGKWSESEAPILPTNATSSAVIEFLVWLKRSWRSCYAPIGRFISTEKNYEQQEPRARFVTRSPRGSLTRAPAAAADQMLCRRIHIMRHGSVGDSHGQNAIQLLLTSQKLIFHILVDIIKLLMGDQHKK